MTQSCNPLFDPAIIDCMAEDRAPTAEELTSVAERIRRDAGERSAFDWGPAPVDAATPALLRAAHFALCGGDEGRRGESRRS